jgi:hypothetical protein
MAACVGGPTKSGHRTPAVIVNVPVGKSRGVVRLPWMFAQVMPLAHGVPGIRTPAAVRAF